MRERESGERKKEKKKPNVFSLFATHPWPPCASRRREPSTSARSSGGTGTWSRRRRRSRAWALGEVVGVLGRRRRRRRRQKRRLLPSEQLHLPSSPTFHLWDPSCSPFAASPVKCFYGVDSREKRGSRSGLERGAGVAASFDEKMNTSTLPFCALRLLSPFLVRMPRSSHAEAGSSPWWKEGSRASLVSGAAMLLFSSNFSFDAFSLRKTKK